MAGAGVDEEPRALRSAVTASAHTAAFYATSSACYGARARLAEVFAAPFDQTKSAAPIRTIDGHRIMFGAVQTPGARTLDQC